MILSMITGCTRLTIKSQTLYQNLQVIPFLPDLPVYRFTLENGLRLLVIEDHTSPTFAYQTWYRVGSRHETVGKTGLAHLFEHMMFKETKNMKEGEFDRLLESLGGQGENAFTSYDYTAYVQELPSHPSLKTLECIIRAEAERMTQLMISPQAFQTEREVVQNERRFRQENNPDARLFQGLFELAFTQHPYRWPIIGYEQDLANMSIHDAIEFYQKHYAPNHATVIIAGDVNAQDVYPLIHEYYHALTPQISNLSNSTLLRKEPEQTKPREKDFKLDVSLEKLILGYPIPPFLHADTPAIELFVNIMGVGNSSRLSRLLVDSGLANTVGMINLMSHDPSLCVIAISLQKKDKISFAETLVLKNFESFLNEPITQAELNRAKNKMKYKFYNNLASSVQKAYFLGQFESLAQDFTEGLKFLEKTQSVQPQDLKRIAKSYFLPQKRNVIRGRPL